MDERPIQTRVKHEILQAYLSRWGGIILFGLRAQYAKASREGWAQRFEAKLLYIDCFSFEGLYEENGQEAYGSPVIGIQALDNHREFAVDNRIGFIPQRNVVLFERKKKTYDILVSNLNKLGYGPRLKQDGDLASLQDGEIAVIHGEYQGHLEPLLRYSGQDTPRTFAFYLLDPYGPSGIPLGSVSRIVSQPRNDVMINFPIYEVYKKAGSVIKETPEHEQHIKYINEMFGSEDWQALAANLSGDQLEEAYAQHYKFVLEEHDQTLAVKTIPLRFQDMEKKGYYLALTTHDGTGGLAMNQILDSALVSEYDHRAQRRKTMGGQLLMPGFDEIEDIARPTLFDADIAEVAREILQQCHDTTIPYREVLKRMVNSPYYPNDIEAGIKSLKRQDRAKYEGDLKNRTIIVFN